jgi:hypothetical protein
MGCHLETTSSGNWFAEQVQPVCLPVGANQQFSDIGGVNLTVAGWGATENGEFSPTNCMAGNQSITLEESPVFGAPQKGNHRCGFCTNEKCFLATPCDSVVTVGPALNTISVTLNKSHRR